MPGYRLLAVADEFYKGRAIQAAEDVASLFGAVLVPAPCIHQRRRRPDRRVMIFGRTYYVLEPDELTQMEYAKYQTYVKSQ